MVNRRIRSAAAAAALVAGLLAQTVPTITAASAQPTAPTAPPVAYPASVSTADRAEVLGSGYESSTDLLWTLDPSSEGLTVMTATVASGAEWHTAATLSVAGVQSRQWVGNACVVQGTHVAAVAFGPVEYISTSRLFESGAFAGLVDLETGSVTYVPDIRPSFSYFSPMCGSDGTAEFSSFGVEESTTSVWRVRPDGTAGLTLDKAPGEYVQVVDAPQGQMGMRAGNVVSLAAGGSRKVPLPGMPPGVVRIQATSTGLAVLASAPTSRTTEAYLWSPGTGATLVASGSEISLEALSDGDVTVHGPDITRRATIRGVHVIRGPSLAQPSVEGTSLAAPVAARGSSTSHVDVTGTTGVTRSVAASSDAAPTWAAEDPTTTAATGSQSTTTDPNLPCAVQRNDPTVEAYQPSVRQVEWAVDLAIKGKLTGTHPADYRHYGLPAWSPQGRFPRAAITGNGTFPSALVLGVLANESNLWQASSHVSPGGYGNELTGNIYGRTSDSELTIDFNNSDCGYGIAQVTDGMRQGGQNATSQKMIALDYQTNIAVGLNILISKWNQLAGYGITMNDGISTGLENWYGALWAYNTGIQPDANNGNTTGCVPGPTCTDSAGNWGLGWANNPANPIYLAHRHIFNSNGTDPTVPNLWPYQERVIGWAANPIYEPGGSYDQAFWPTDTDRDSAIPDPALFCDSTNHCSGASTTRQGFCAQSDSHCWTHHAVSWKTCRESGTNHCASSDTRYFATDPEPADPGTLDPATCNTTPLTAAAVIVDDYVNSQYSPCTGAPTSGSFKFTFKYDANGNMPGHIDLHQVNGGLNGHYWFTHTLKSSTEWPIVGTWTFPTNVNGWGKVYAHVPASGAQTYQAHYTITDGSNGAVRTRVVDTYRGQNAWISLGSMHLGSGSTVALSSLSAHDTPSDVAFDAVAFVPGAKPAFKVVGLGDSYASGEGNPPFDTVTPSDNEMNSCHRSGVAFTRQLVMPGQTKPAGTNTNDEVDLLACSGAHTVSLTADAVNAPGDPAPYATQWGSPVYQDQLELQLDQGWVDADTDLVTLTVGGDDARFAKVVAYCIGLSSPVPSNCSDPGQIMPGDTQDLVTTEPRIIATLLPAKYVAVLKAIHQRAPQATILVGNYPHLFTPNGSDGTCYSEFSHGDKLWLNDMATVLDNTVKGAVDKVAATGVKVYLVDVQPAFTSHELCTQTPYINGITVPQFGFSFHPNFQGQTSGYTVPFQTAVTARLN